MSREADLSDRIIVAIGGPHLRVTRPGTVGNRLHVDAKPFVCVKQVNERGDAVIQFWHEAMPTPAELEGTTPAGALDQPWKGFRFPSHERAVEVAATQFRRVLGLGTARGADAPAAGGAAPAAGGSAARPADGASPVERVARPFDPSAVPTPPTPSQNEGLSPEERAQKLEKAHAAHHAILVRLHGALREAGWTDIEEIPSSVDLMARKDGVRVLFEAKSITPTNALAQTRSALSQLLEYRFFVGRPDDLLCLAVDAPVPEHRVRFLNEVGVCVVVVNEEGVLDVGGGREVLRALGASVPSEALGRAS